ncbi:MAG: FAD-dependent monooxygenase [Pseudomonadota bacterium]|nr:FAD-dependent monooxygenase [Pseudomonadota bacterium]
MKVIIVGGGIAGLAAAIAVARTKHRVLLLERSPRIEERGAGLQIGPNGIKALDWLGAWELLRDKTWQPQHLRFMNGLTGQLIRSMALAGSFERSFGSPYVVVLRADLLAALQVRAGAAPGVEIRTGCEVTGFEWRGAEPTVRLADTAETADAVIGADGVHSTVRRHLLDDGPALHGNHVLFRALVPRNRAPAVSPDVLVWFYPGGHVVHYPVAGGKLINFVAVAQEATGGEATSASPSEVATAFPAMTTELRYLLGLPETWHRWRSSDRRPVRRWGTGPATLIGDAAHPMAPYLAQGAAAALEDSVTLGEALEGASDVAGAFRQFERRRIARTSRLARASRRQGGVYHATGWSAFLRDVLLANVPAGLLLAQVRWIYAWRPPGTPG